MAMREMVIRDLRSSDVEAVKRIEVSSGLSEWTAGAYLAESARSGSRVLVADITGHIAGFVVGRISQYTETESQIELLNIATDPKHRGNGIGRALLESLIKSFASDKPDSVLLEVRESNRQAIQFYEQSGFTCLGRRTGFYSSPSENALTYFLPLKWR